MKGLYDEDKEFQMLMPTYGLLVDQSTNICKVNMEYSSVMQRNEAYSKGLNTFLNMEYEYEM